MKQQKNKTYATGLLSITTRMIAFDHCTMRNGQEYIRIKDRDLALATHPLVKQIVYIPLLDQDIGLFLFKKTPDVDVSNVKAFNDFARNIIDVRKLQNNQYRTWKSWISRLEMCIFHASNMKI